MGLGEWPDLGIFPITNYLQGEAVGGEGMLLPRPWQVAQALIQVQCMGGGPSWLTPVFSQSKFWALWAPPWSPHIVCLACLTHNGLVLISFLLVATAPGPLDSWDRMNLLHPSRVHSCLQQVLAKVAEPKASP